MPTLGYFVLPVYCEVPGQVDYNLIQKELSDVFEKLNFSQQDNWTSETQELSENAFTQNMLGLHDFKHFLKFVDRSVQQYLDDIGHLHKKLGDHSNRQYVITTSWFTKQKKGHYAHLHNHSGTDLSGVYYFKTNGMDGNMYFHSPYHDKKSNFIYEVIAEEQEIQVEQGMLCLFPADLMHATKVNETDHERVSLAFNIEFRRQGFVLDEEYDYDRKGRQGAMLI